jgi:hypothetical protein
MDKDTVVNDTGVKDTGVKDTGIEQLISKFKEYEDTHPNIVCFWVTYLELKKKNRECILDQGHSILAQIQGEEKIKDIDINDLVTMMLIKMIL